MRSRGSGREETRWDGEGQPEQRRRRSLLALLDLNSRKKKGTGTRSIQDRERIRGRSAEGEDRRRARRVELSAVDRGMGVEHSDEHGINSDPFDRFLLNFDHSKLKFSYRNMKFSQNRSCRGREDLQLLFWANVDLRLGLRRKNTVKHG